MPLIVSYRPRIQRMLGLMTLYGGALWLGGLLSFLLRFDLEIPVEYQGYWRLWLGVVFLKVVILAPLGQYSGLVNYFSLPDFKRIGAGMTLASAVLILGNLASPGSLIHIPRGVILTDWVVSIGLLTCLRLVLRTLRQRQARPQHDGPRRRVAIVGAGDVGAKLLLELSSRPGLGMLPVVLFDDDVRKHGTQIHGFSVIGSPERLSIEASRLELNGVIVAMPSAPARRIGEMVQICRRAGLRCDIVPSMEQLATGRVRVTQIREVNIEDLLGRQAVEVDVKHIGGILEGRIVMVTGAGGSIGSELCRQIADFAPAKLLLLDQAEVQLFPIEQELIELGHRAMVVPIVADVLDAPRVEQLFQEYKPDVVFHAAAHKHVPMMELQPGEAVQNNSVGTASIAEIALRGGVSRFLLVSTDKAVNPTSVMGASKRLAEIYVQSLYAAHPDKTKFMAVRFGNVLGSSGSVVPILRKQIARGGPVTVTHRDVTRYFMTIPEAVGLVLQSAAIGNGGETFVLDMGRPMKIIDLARQLIELSGLRPEIDIEIEFTGLRAGEKMFEEICLKSEEHLPTEHPKIKRFCSQAQPLKDMRAVMLELRQVAPTADPAEMRRLLRRCVPEYRPSGR